MTRLGILLIAAAAFAPAAIAADDDATKLATKLTTEGASTYNSKDARAMAAFYTEDAQLTVLSREEGSTALKTEVKKGRAEVEEFYAKLFEGEAVLQARNKVDFARKIGSDVLIISGTFQPNMDEDLAVPFVQTRVRRGDKWLVSNLQIFILPAKD